MIYWTYPMQQNKYPWRDLKKKQELKFVTVLTFYLVMWSLKLNYKDLIGCLGFFSLFIVFSETTCYFHTKKNIILFNSYFSFYFFQNLTNFDIDSYMKGNSVGGKIVLGNNEIYQDWPKLTEINQVLYLGQILVVYIESSFKQTFLHTNL